MQACDGRIESLVDAASGDLAPAARAELESHLSLCEGCRVEFAGLLRTTALLRQTAPVPDDLWLSGFPYRTASRAEAFRDRSPRGLWWSLTRGTRLALMFSASSLAASVMLFAAARPLVPAPVAVAARTPAAVVAPSVAVAAPEAAGDQADAWELYIPQAVAAVHEQGPILDEGASDSALSLDWGLESLTPGEMDALTRELEEIPG